MQPKQMEGLSQSLFTAVAPGVRISKTGSLVTSSPASILTQHMEDTKPTIVASMPRSRIVRMSSQMQNDTSTFDFDSQSMAYNKP